MEAITPTSGGVLLHLLVQPRASRSEIAGLHDRRIKLRLAAPPVEGAANQALIHLLSRRLDIPRASIRIRSGEGSRRKTVLVEGITVERVRALLDLG